MPSRMPLSTGVSRASSVAYDTRVEDYLLSDRISNVDYLSNATLDYSDNTVRRSRGRDQQLLRDATNAIVSTETYATPQASAISRRVARGRSVAPRAASLPPRSLYPEVELMLPSTTIKSAQVEPQLSASYYYPSRPIVVYAMPPQRQDRAMSVPPRVVYAEKRLQKQQREPTYVARNDWRQRARAMSLPPTQVHTPRSVHARRRYQALGKVVPAPIALDTSGLRAHVAPRRFVSAARLAFPILPGKADSDRNIMRRNVTRARVLASPIARAQLARAQGRSLYSYYAPAPKAVPTRESLSDFPKVYVPVKKGQKPSNRSKAAIIASKLEPDPLKRRKPRSEFAANKYRELRKDAKESIYSGGYGGYSTPTTTGMHASNPPLCGADPSNPPVSDLRRRIRRTLNKTRHSSMY